MIGHVLMELSENQGMIDPGLKGVRWCCGTGVEDEVRVGMMRCDDKQTRKYSDGIGREIRADLDCGRHWTERELTSAGFE